MTTLTSHHTPLTKQISHLLHIKSTKPTIEGRAKMVGTDLLSLGFALLLIFLLRKFLLLSWFNPRKIEKQFRSQGIEGPSYKFLIGSFKELAMIYKSKPAPTTVGAHMKHTLIQDLLPHLHLWREKYGRVFLYWFGPSPRVVVTEPDLIKEMLNNTKAYHKSIPHPAVYDMVGDGLIFAEGDKWARHRRILSPFFTTEALKGYVPTVVSSTGEMIKRWEDSLKLHGPELEVHSQFRTLTKTIIARTAFQSNFKQVDRIVELQIQQMAMLTQALRTFYIPGSRFLPTPFNIKSWRVRRELEEMFRQLINSRDESIKDNDLLGLMLLATNNDENKGKNMSPKELMDECRTFFVAGFETTSLLVTWAFVLLSIHTEWQDKARHEVEQVLQGKLPDYDTLPHLKIVNMILNETLRLYSPAPFIMKNVEKEVKLGNLTVPAGTNLEIPIIALHHDPQQWGDNVDEFDPSRFSEGVSKASKDPMAFMPFTSGTRVCIGMNFSMMEAKITLSMILQKFSFVISPSYKHSPDCLVTTSPVHGAHILFHQI